MGHWIIVYTSLLARLLWWIALLLLLILITLATLTPVHNFHLSQLFLFSLSFSLSLLTSPEESKAAFSFIPVTVALHRGDGHA